MDGSTHFDLWMQFAEHDSTIRGAVEIKFKWVDGSEHTFDASHIKMGSYNVALIGDDYVFRAFRGTGDLDNPDESPTKSYFNSVIQHNATFELWHTLAPGTGEKAKKMLPPDFSTYRDVEVTITWDDGHGNGLKVYKAHAFVMRVIKCELFDCKPDIANEFIHKVLECYDDGFRCTDIKYENLGRCNGEIVVIDMDGATWHTSFPGYPNSDLVCTNKATQGYAEGVYGVDWASAEGLFKWPGHVYPDILAYQTVFAIGGTVMELCGDWTTFTQIHTPLPPPDDGELPPPPILDDANRDDIPPARPEQPIRKTALEANLRKLVTAGNVDAHLIEAIIHRLNEAFVQLDELYKPFCKSFCASFNTSFVL